MGKKSLKEFKEEFIYIHKNKYDYSLINELNYFGSQVKVPIICTKLDKDGFEHGVFWQSPTLHKKHGCKKCSMELLWNNSSSSKEEFVKKALTIKKHINFNYNYDDFMYINCDTKGKIWCPKPNHGFFEQSPYLHINLECGCPICNRNQLTTDEFIEMSKLTHPVDFVNFDFSQTIYKNTRTPVIIICLKNNHGKFEQVPNDHIYSKAGCPLCKSSKGEKNIRHFLADKNIEFERQKIFKNCINNKTNKNLQFDFYLPDYNMCIEYDGIQHFKVIEYWGGQIGYEERKKSDLTKTKYCKQNNIELIRINYLQIENIETILLNKLKTSIM